MRKLLAVCVVVGLTTMASMSQAALIDFSALTPGSQGVGNSVVEDGFTFTCTTWDDELLVHQYLGENWLSTPNWDQVIQMTAEGDAAFQIDSLLINAWTNAGWAAGEALTINGYDGATLAETLTVNWPATPQTVTLGWSGVTRVDFDWNPAWGDITDIVAQVPEPASLSVLGLVGLTALRRGRR